MANNLIPLIGPISVLMDKFIFITIFPFRETYSDCSKKPNTSSILDFLHVCLSHCFKAGKFSVKYYRNIKKVPKKE